MRISVVIQSSTSATVTLLPGLLARWFLGRDERTFAVFYGSLHRIHHGPLTHCGWIDEEGREVTPRVANLLDRAMTIRAVRERHERLVRR